MKNKNIVKLFCILLFLVACKIYVKKKGIDLLLSCVRALNNKRADKKFNDYKEIKTKIVTRS
ncbi:hypothetical protein [Borreliella bavariensis]|uniref:hypothetical protein n=1 Tax=Borreliella bavariensis TaxID=664662 RepID=UPI0039B6FEEF